jgi:hypothetical protein
MGAPRGTLALPFRALQPFLIQETSMPNLAPTQGGTSDLEILQRLNSDYIRSVGESDVAWFQQNLAADFLNSGPDGSLTERKQFLAQVAQPCPVFDLQAEDVRIRLLGDIAIIHGRTVYRMADGRTAAGRYTDVYARRQGRWLCVSADVTRG